MPLPSPSRMPSLLIMLVILGVGGALFGGAVFAGDRGPLIPKGKGEQCVAETDFMRRNHMDLIIHQRDETVIKGIRDEPFSLTECVDCHVQRDANDTPIRVDAEGQFCASCHTFVAAKIDCFSCHAAIPDADREAQVDEAHWHPNKKLLAMMKRSKSSPIAAEGKISDEASN